VLGNSFSSDKDTLRLYAAEDDGEVMDDLPSFSSNTNLLLQTGLKDYAIVNCAMEEDGLKKKEYIHVRLSKGHSTISVLPITTALIVSFRYLVHGEIQQQEANWNTLTFHFEGPVTHKPNEMWVEELSSWREERGKLMTTR